MNQADLFNAPTPDSLHVRRDTDAPETRPIAVMGRKVRYLLSGLSSAGELEPASRLALRNWLAELDNWRIWCAFYHKAERLRRAGREHYGARALVEVIRFDSILADADSLFKISNNVTPLLGRLYNAVAGVEFFETRGTSHNGSATNDS